jgi:hypothetical protein
MAGRRIDQSEVRALKRDFALRIDTLLSSVRASLDSISGYMKHHISCGDLSDDEFKRYVQHIGKSMVETIKISNDLYAAFPDIVPDELKSE